MNFASTSVRTKPKLAGEVPADVAFQDDDAFRRAAEAVAAPLKAGAGKDPLVLLLAIDFGASLAAAVAPLAQVAPPPSHRTSALETYDFCSENASLFDSNIPISVLTFR